MHLVDGFPTLLLEVAEGVERPTETRSHSVVASAR